MTAPRQSPRPLPHRPDVFVEVAMTAPVFVIYQLGLLVLDVQNGADWITGLLMRLLSWSRLAYVGFVLLFGLGMFLVAKRATRKPEKLLGRIVLEGALFALGLILTVGFVGRIMLPNLLGFSRDSIPGAVILSAGAGFHEELLFRVVGFEGGSRALRSLGRSELRSSLLAALLSSLLFALAHHLGTFGEPFRLVPFTMRLVSGLYLCAVLRYRGFATAVYAHTLYDIFVLL